MWLQVRTKVWKPQEDGAIKKITENYITEAVSISDAETKITEHLSDYYGTFEVVNISQTAFSEVVFAKDGISEHWYKAKLKFITLDEKSGKEKNTNIAYLFEAESVQGAINSVKEFMKGSVCDYTISSVQETNIFDVVP